MNFELVNPQLSSVGLFTGWSKEVLQANRNSLGVSAFWVLKEFWDLVRAGLPIKRTLISGFS